MPTNTAARRAELYSLLGPLPPRAEPVECRLLWTEEHDGWVREELRLITAGRDLPATLTRPASPGPHPAVLYSHWHAGQYDLGRRELLEGVGFQPAYGPLLARMGYVTLCIDQINFGERRGRTESSVFKQLLWHGEVLWGHMVWESLKALDYLAARPDVDAARIGALGLSMGSTMSWWVSALDERIFACADLCCMTEFDSAIESGGFDGHGIFYYVPGLLNHFTTAQINELICPRWHLSQNGDYDPLTPPKGLALVDDALQKVYASAGVPERWRMVRELCGHMETAAMRKNVLEFLEKVLKG